MQEVEGTTELKEARGAAIGLVGGSKKMTVVYWLTPFAAAVTILFDYWQVDADLVRQFWEFFKLVAGGYLGVQGIGDAITRGIEAMGKKKTSEPTNTVGAIPGATP